MDSKINEIITEQEKLLSLLDSEEIYSDHKKYSSINSQIENNKKLYTIAKEIYFLKTEIEESQNLLTTSSTASDIEFYNNVITHNSTLLSSKLIKLQNEISDSNKINNPSILEIRPGTGGDESTLFASDIFRMYSNYFNSKGWQINILSAIESSVGGLKEAILEINELGSYSLLRFESGIHRVQRIPSTETSGRIHTSAVSVVIFPQVEEHQVELNISDVEIYTYRSSGPGGQSVNTTDSAIRILHKPTGITVTCQDGKSQLKNKEKALKILRGKLYDIELSTAQSEISTIRKSSIKSGDRSDKIRTYNYPQNRVTDHRVNQSWYGLSDIMNGDIEQIITDIRNKLLIL
jgi:peptide chain release factor 1